MKYECIFSDIDGTLLNDQHQVSHQTKQKIKELSSVHIPFILVSARMPKSIRAIQKELEINEPMICYSGGLIIDNGKVILSKTIDSLVVSKLLSFISTNSDICATVYFEDEWLVSDIENPWVKQESQITSIIPQNMKNIKEAHKILCMGKSQDIDKLEQELLNHFHGLSIYKSKSTYLEIMDGSISKSQAIQKFCSYYHVALDKTISFGDNYNDIDMLKTTKWGFAMSNAPIGVLKEIERHTLSNNEDGIVYALNELIGE